MTLPSVDPAPSASSPTVAVAFGGGGARGLAHIHVIEALDELGIVPVAISGSSIGAIMGAAMASGLSGADIHKYTIATVGRRREIVNRIWSLRPTTIATAVSGGFRVGQFNLERLLKVFLPEGIPQDFDGLNIPLKVMTTDYYGQTECVRQSGDLFQALAASAAIPAVFMPVRIDGRIMIDGGIYNPVPFDHLAGLADIVIGVDVVGGPEGDGESMPSRIDSLYGSSQLMMQSIISMKLKAGAPDILLRPDVSRFRVMDFLKAAEVLRTTAPIKEELKKALAAEIERRIKGTTVTGAG